MKIISNISQMSEYSRAAHLHKKSIGFVPTMGALHEGHLHLIRQARKDNALVIVSIFVNPVQFGPSEDFKKYPRNLKADSELCRKEGVDAIFYPALGQMYPNGYKTYVTVEGLSDCLCGKFRPGHFRGVLTVVNKLFNIACPDSAYFGWKDAQQAILIDRMAKDLNMPVKVKIMPTVRGKDGLAISSRNIYLSPQEREDAVVLRRALNLARDSIGRGDTSSRDIIRKMKQLISAKKSAKIQYISIVDMDNLKPVNRVKGKSLVALAVYFGKTRLIDNIIINHNSKFS